MGVGVPTEFPGDGAEMADHLAQVELAAAGRVEGNDLCKPFGEPGYGTFRKTGLGETSMRGQVFAGHGEAARQRIEE